MNLLLINPNRYRTPPVPPLGLLHVASALMGTRHRVHVLDLCFEDNPHSALTAALAVTKPNIAGITIRNIDTVLYPNTQFFLDDIRELAGIVHAHGIPVLLGGAGFSFVPESIIEYTSADWGIAGPGENAIVDFLDRCEKTFPPAGTIADGWSAGIPSSFRVTPVHGVDFSRYTAERGIVGFETQKGCNGECVYCGERRRNILLRDPEAIVADLQWFTERGFDTFHLCDTEFNQNLDFCKTFLDILVRKGPRISWVLYLKVNPWDDNLFRLLKESGATMATLSVPTGGANWQYSASGLIACAQSYGIKIAVDLLTGLPGESLDDTRRAIDALRTMKPDTVGVNAFIRLLPGLPVTGMVMETPAFKARLIGDIADNPHLLRPVFYNHLDTDTLRSIIGSDPLFTIEGAEATSNYERV